MLSEGKITPEEAEQLLEKVDQDKPAPESDGGQRNDSSRTAGANEGVGVSVNIGGMGNLLGNLGSMIEKTAAQANESAQVSAVRADGSAGASAFSFASGGSATPGNASSRSRSSGTGLKQGNRSVAIEHKPATALSVRTDNGTVRVSQAQGNEVHIEATIRARSDERLAATTLNVDRDDQGTLHVAPAWPDNERETDEGCDFTITVPDMEGIRVVTGNGDIDLQNLAGDAVLETANGDVTVHDQDGAVDARTNNGCITLEGVQGAAIARANNGRVAIREARGAVEVKTSNAAVDVGLTPDNEGPVDVDTNNAMVSLSVGSAFKGALSLSTSNGKVHTEPDAESMALAIRTELGFHNVLISKSPTGKLVRCQATTNTLT